MNSYFLFLFLISQHIYFEDNCTKVKEAHLHERHFLWGTSTPFAYPPKSRDIYSNRVQGFIIKIPHDHKILQASYSSPRCLKV